MIKTIKKILLFATCFMLLECNRLSKSENRAIEESVESIAPGVPFMVVRDNMFLELPDDFTDERIEGVLGLTVYIDSSQNLNGFKIMKLNVVFSGKVDVNYVNESGINRPISKQEYPLGVQKYYSVIEKYINELQFERDDRIPLRELNGITFIARLK